MNQNKHAQEMATRFKDIYELSGGTFSEEHYNELTLVIEAGLDAALIEQMEKIADLLAELSHNIRHNAETDNAQEEK